LELTVERKHVELFKADVVDTLELANGKPLEEVIRALTSIQDDLKSNDPEISKITWKFEYLWDTVDAYLVAFRLETDAEYNERILQEEKKELAKIEAKRKKVEELQKQLDKLKSELD